MKRLAFVLLFLSGSALAQPQQRSPEVIQSDKPIEVAVGEAKVLRFSEAFSSPVMTSKDIADIIPQSDHMLTITGLSPGATAFFLKDEGDRVIYTGSILVTPSSGRLVKIYRRDVNDYVGYYCSEFGCGRADLDKKLANSRDPNEPTVTVISKPLPDGGVVTRQFGPR